MSMTRMHSIVRTAVVVMVASLMSARAVHAQDCSVATLSSDFVTSWSGNNPAPVAALGVLTFDGAGNLTGFDTVSFNGAIYERTITGTYTVNPDCTGTISWTTSIGSFNNLNIVIYKGGTKIRFISTVAMDGVVEYGSATLKD